MSPAWDRSGRPATRAWAAALASTAAALWANPRQTAGVSTQPEELASDAAATDATIRLSDSMAGRNVGRQPLLPYARGRTEERAVVRARHEATHHREENSYASIAARFGGAVRPRPTKGHGPWLPSLPPPSFARPVAATKGDAPVPRPLQLARPEKKKSIAMPRRPRSLDDDVALAAPSTSGGAARGGVETSTAASRVLYLGRVAKFWLAQIVFILVKTRVVRYVRDINRHVAWESRPRGRRAAGGRRPSVGRRFRVCGSLTASRASFPHRNLLNRLSHLPHGFYEEALLGYFSQFGELTRVRLSRSKRTGGSRGYAFLEFKDADVCSIAAESMDGYMMFGQRLVARVVSPARQHPRLFSGADRKFRVLPRQEIARERHDRMRTPEEEQRRVAKAVRRDAKRKRRLEAGGYDYDYPGLVEQARARQPCKVVFPEDLD